MPAVLLRCTEDAEGVIARCVDVYVKTRRVPRVTTSDIEAEVQGYSCAQMLWRGVVAYWEVDVDGVRVYLATKKQQQSVERYVPSS